MQLRRNAWRVAALISTSGLAVALNMGNGRSSVSGGVDHLLSLENVPQHQTLFAPFDHAHPGLFLRKVEVFCIATRVFSDYKLLAWRCAQIDDTAEGEARKDLLWEEAHTRNAAYLYEKFSKLEALWIKLGQYLSSRADVMPAPYLRELAKCQDSLPAVPFDVIRSIVERELGPLETIFRSVEQTPLAVASIASVHKAVLLDGREVVIKVQHQSVREKLLQDLKCLSAIGDMVRYLDPDMDFSPVVSEWSQEVPKELDFVNEVRNMKRVASSIAPFYHSQDVGLTINVRLADVVDHLVTKNVLVMKLVNGFKIDNRTLLDEHGLDREILVRGERGGFCLLRRLYLYSLNLTPFSPPFLTLTQTSLEPTHTKSSSRAFIRETHTLGTSL